VGDESVVHHGEIVPRQPGGSNGESPPWPTTTPTAAAGEEPTHSDKDA
jgi:hypothetical protein